MSKWQYDNVRTMLAVSDRALRATVRHSLAGRGLRAIREGHTIDDVRVALLSGEVDLLIVSAMIPGGDIGAMLQDMRHHKVGENPFVIVMTLLDNPSPDLVRRVVDTGTDDLLLMPLMPVQLGARIDNFVTGRKPFAITHDYIGPDRRSADRPGSQPAPRMEVPNPIRYQVVANANRKSLEEQIRNASLMINMHKMRRYCIQITWLVERIVKAFFGGETAQMIADAVALEALSDDLMNRMRGTIYSPATELVVSLQVLCQRLARDDRQARQAEVEILPTLARAVQRIFDDGAEENPATA